MTAKDELLERLERLDYYTLLGVELHVTEPELRKAFRTFARKYHPDRFAGAPAEHIARATRIYRRGAEALQTLLDPAARKTYDASLRRAAQPSRSTEDGRTSIEAEMKREIATERARGHYRAALIALHRNELQTAWTEISCAALAEPGNHYIRARVEQISAMRQRERRNKA